LLDEYPSLSAAAFALKAPWALALKVDQLHVSLVTPGVPFSVPVCIRVEAASLEKKKHWRLDDDNAKKKHWRRDDANAKKSIGVVNDANAYFPKKKSIGVVQRCQCRIGNLVPCARYMCPRAVEAAHAPAKEPASLGLGGLSCR